MKLIEDMVGEYILCTKKMYPNCVMFYKNKDIEKYIETNDVNSKIESLCNQLKCKESDYAKYVLNNLNEIEEVVFNKDGLIRFSIKVEKWKI